MHRLILETVTESRGMGDEERNRQRITPIRGRHPPAAGIALGPEKVPTDAQSGAVTEPTGGAAAIKPLKRSVASEVRRYEARGVIVETESLRSTGGVTTCPNKSRSAGAGCGSAIVC